MSRFTSRRNSYRQHIQRFSSDHFRLSWVVDFYYPDSNLRHPRRFTRDTDAKGAARFSRKWEVAIPPANGAEPNPHPAERSADHLEG